MTATTEKTAFESITSAFQQLGKNITTLRTETLEFRKERLRRLREWIHNNRPLIHRAMFEDFRKPAVEVDAIELFHVLNEIKLALAELDQWTKPKKIDAPLTMLGTRSFIQYEPRGVCLIISPWNYAFSLAVGPLVAAIAAGNAVILKPSELTPHVSGVLAKMANEVFSNNVVRVFEGGPRIAQHLLTLPFDHIFFTGSPQIGKAVMKAAAENLASVTLELGGKSPAIITDSANIKEAAQRCAVAKFVNNGQTCVAPDYILADEKIVDNFVKEFISQTKKLFSANGNFESSPSYCRIVNERHFLRLHELLQDAIQAGAKLEWGGHTQPASRFFHPTVLTHVPPYARLMEEEIFGPVMPVITYKNLDEAIAFVNDKPKALALYLFTNRKKQATRF